MLKQNLNVKRIQYIGLLLIIAGLFICLFQLRWQIIFALTGSQRFYIWAINFVALSGYMSLVITNISTFKKPELFIILSITISFIPVAISKYMFGFGAGSFIVYVTCCILPISLITLNVDYEVLKNSLAILMIIINIIFIALAVGFLIDKFFDRAMIKWLGSFMTANTTFSRFAQPTSEETSRYFSIFGHPLLTSFVANMFLVLNIVSRRQNISHTLPNTISFILSLIITAGTASKTSIFVIFLIALICFYNNKKMLIGGFVFILLFSAIGMFDSLLDRILQNSLSSGRIEALQQFLSATEFPLHLFYGYANTEITNAQYFAAFEFPIVLSAFEYGILFMFLFIIAPFLYVTYHLIKTRQYSIYFFWLTLFAQVNTYPTLAQGYDHPWFFYFISFILLQFAKHNFWLSSEKH